MYNLFTLLILAYPIAATIINLIFSFKKELTEKQHFFLRLNDIFGILAGAFFSYIFVEFSVNVSERWPDWQEQILSYQKHSPIWSQATPTVLTLFVISLIGYLVLAYLPVEKLPPLVLGLSISATYLGLLALIPATIQVPGIFLYPINLVLIYFRVIRQAIQSWKEWATPPAENKPFRYKLYLLLQKSVNWHLFAILLALPFLAVILIILTLWGQEPDYIIRAWTETSDWALSTKISPPSIQADEHYLCTVGASGHRKIVKPIRRGVRHGHEIVVNRQLLIANAFEQVLEEKIPHIHGFIRRNYDKYGYPIARHIKKAWQADVIYFLMKPLEWIFLAVLYLVDTKPENRIAVQYFIPPTNEKSLGQKPLA